MQKHTHIHAHTLMHTHSQELIAGYCGIRPLGKWKFFLRIRVLPKTPQHLQEQDPVAFQYYYDQVYSLWLHHWSPIEVICTYMCRYAYKYSSNFGVWPLVIFVSICLVCIALPCNHQSVTTSFSPIIVVSRVGVHSWVNTHLMSQQTISI